MIQAIEQQDPHHQGEHSPNMRARLRISGGAAGSK
jgi:hypothetical protein